MSTGREWEICSFGLPSYAFYRLLPLNNVLTRVKQQQFHNERIHSTTNTHERNQRDNIYPLQQAYAASILLKSKCKTFLFINSIQILQHP